MQAFRMKISFNKFRDGPLQTEESKPHNEEKKKATTKKNIIKGVMVEGSTENQGQMDFILSSEPFLLQQCT